MSVSLLFLIFYVIPILFVILDKNTSGREKIGWLILVLVFSFLALPFYLIKTKKSD